MKKIELKHLYLVRAISGTGNLTKAAKMLNISQPALSRQLLDIEAQLSTRLFFRTTKRMTLTNAGELLLNSAEKVIYEMEKLEERISRIAGEQAGELKIGIGCPMSHQWLPAAMEKLHGSFPLVDLHIGITSDHVHDLREKKFDLVITTKYSRDKNLKSLQLFNSEIKTILKPGHPLAEKQYLEIADFDAARLISLVPKHQDIFYKSMLQTNNIELANYFCVEQFHGVIELARKGFGISVLPEWSVRSWLDSHQLVAKSITENGVFVDWKVIYPDEKKIPEYKKYFLNILTKINPANTSTFDEQKAY